MVRAIAVALVSCIVFVACTQRLVCPAYQSAFIYDQATLQKQFSYFVDDSTPKVLTASKTKYLIAEPTSYQKKLRGMQTINMKQVFPVVPDSLRDDYVSKAELDSAANSIIDSTYIVDVNKNRDTTAVEEDSVYVITKDKEVRYLKYDKDSMKYSVIQIRLNVDQDNYMWYLRDNLILPDVKISKMQQANEKEEAKKKKGKGLKGFFKNLFKKKKKEKADTTNVAPVRGENDFDFVDTTQVQTPTDQHATTAKKKKKGLFGRKKEKVAEPTTTPAVKEETVPEEKPKRKKKKDTNTGDGDNPPDKKDDEEKDDGF